MQEHLPEFEGRRVDILAIQVGGSPEDGGIGRELRQDQRITIVARIKVDEVSFKTKNGVTTRKHKAIVEELYEVPASVLDHAHMTITGQGALDLGGLGGAEDRAAYVRGYEQGLAEGKARAGIVNQILRDGDGDSDSDSGREG